MVESVERKNVLHYSPCGQKSSKFLFSFVLLQLEIYRVVVLYLCICLHTLPVRVVVAFLSRGTV